MRKRRFTDEQIVAIVREAGGGRGTEVCRRHGISMETLRRVPVERGLLGEEAEDPLLPRGSSPAASRQRSATSASP